MSTKNYTTGERELTEALVARLKQDAKKLKKAPNFKELASYRETTPQRLALDLVAVREGYESWNRLDLAHRKYLTVVAKTAQPSLKFVNADDFDWSSEIDKLIQLERSEDLTTSQKLDVSSNRAFLAELGIEYSIFEPTLTGLKKSILDATQTVRTHFELVGFHDYEEQNQGPDFKVVKNAYFLNPDSLASSKVSLYRPKTKKGDPRMWFKSLGDFAPASSQVAMIVLNDSAYLLNLSTTDLRKCLSSNNEISKFIRGYQLVNNSVSDKLLSKIRELAKKPIRAVNHGDTAIGMALEHALGIAANSSKEPDYQGIELKAGRNPKNRTNLFAQVADWKLSACKSSREILERYGYQRDDGAFGLYCTVNSIKRNSQGLQFKYVESNDQLHETDANGNNVAVWTGDVLRERLKQKHTETFWIEAESVWVDGVEHFNLKSVIHTKRPLLAQLMPLIQSGVVTMDHLIKRSVGDKPKIVEKGPLFKINKKDLPLLFPKPQKYILSGGE